MIYWIREQINEFRCWQLRISDAINDKCFSVINWLDGFESCKKDRIKDRGI